MRDSFQEARGKRLPTESINTGWLANSRHAVGFGTHGVRYVDTLTGDFHAEGNRLKDRDRKRSRMNRRSFVKIVALAPGAASWAEVPELERACAETGRSADDRSDAHALAGDRFALTLERVLKGEGPAYTEEFVLADVRPNAERRFTGFSGDVSGGYIGALATVARLQRMDLAHLDGLVGELTALQKPDGYFGSSFNFDQPNDADMALLWGNGRLLFGLLEYDQWHRHGHPSVEKSPRQFGVPPTAAEFPAIPAEFPINP
jgi:hypothetical protein